MGLGYGSGTYVLGATAMTKSTTREIIDRSDNQGVRFLIDEVKDKTAWEDREVE